MNKYSVITINLAGVQVVLTDVLVCLIYEDGVQILKVLAGVNPDNTGAIISNGVEFTMDEGSYYMEFMPTSLIQAKK